MEVLLMLPLVRASKSIFHHLCLNKKMIGIIRSPECDRMWALSLSGLLNSLVHPTCVLMEKALKLASHLMT